MTAIEKMGCNNNQAMHSGSHRGDLGTGYQFAGHVASANTTELNMARIWLQNPVGTPYYAYVEYVYCFVPPFSSRICMIHNSAFMNSDSAGAWPYSAVLSGSVEFATL